MTRIALLSVLAVMSVACLGSDFADSVEGSWQLTSGTVDGDEIVLLASHPITLTFDGDKVNGTAACNGYGGSYQLSGGSLRFGAIAMTEMACDPPEAMAAEALFALALTKVESVSLDTELTLTGPATRLVFEALPPVPDAQLTNTVWVLDGLISGELVSSVAADRATLEFFSDGSVLGDTGCRPFAGRYEVDGARIVVTGLESDGHQCQPDLAEQDSQVLSVLQSGFRFEIVEDRLTAFTDDELGLGYLAES